MNKDGGRRGKRGPKSSDDKNAIIEKVLTDIAGGASRIQACRDAGVPESTFREWERADTDLAARYARATEERTKGFAEKIISIIDNPAADNVVVQKQRLQVDALKWMLSKMLPRQYGDKLELSGDAANPIAFTEIRRVVVDKSDVRSDEDEDT